MTDWETCPARVAGTCGGAWVFRDTRVPVTALFENLKDGATLDQFLAWFPGVASWQAAAVLEHAAQSLTASGPA